MKILLLFFIFYSSFSMAQDTQKNRARLLDYMIDNYTELQHPNIRDFLKHCPNMQHTVGANQPYCTSVYSGKKNLLDRLSKLLGKIRNEDISHERVIEVASCLPVTPPSFTDLEHILKRLDSREDCAPMNGGDFKVSNFLLQRKPDGNYDAVVNVNFQKVSGSTTPETMMSRVNQCLSGFTPYFRSPTGETLNVRVMTPSEIESNFPIGLRPPVVEVKLHQGVTGKDANGNDIQFRADAANYPDNIPCHTIVHEALHHLGLCDEYLETSTTILPNSTKTFKDAFSCRVVPSRNTVMANQVSAISEVVPQRFSCRCKTEACRNTLKGTSGVSRHVREIFTKADPYSMLPQAVMRNCRTEYLNPNLYPLNEPGKRAIIIASNEYSLKLDHRYPLQSSGANGEGPSFTIGRRLVDCNCNGDKECISAIPEAIEKINSGPSASSCPYEMESLPNSNTVAQEGERTQVQGDVLQIVTTPTSTNSLLSPNHFNRILYGDCTTGPTGNYNRCASYAYSGSSDSNCSHKPPSCSSDSFFLDGSPQ